MRTLEREEILDRQRPVQKNAEDSKTLPVEADNYTDRFRKAFISKAKNDVTRYIIKQFFERIKSGAKPESIASLFSENVDFYIPGGTELIPWIGRRRGRAGVADYFHELREKIEPTIFEAGSVLVDGAEAVASGGLEYQEKRTGRTIESEFVIAFTIHNALITRFRLFEDSVAVSQAAKKQKRDLVSNY